MKRIDRLKGSKHFRGFILYALAHTPHHMTVPTLIVGNLLGVTVDELTAEFAKTQKLREEVTIPVGITLFDDQKGNHSLANN